MHRVWPLFLLLALATACSAQLTEADYARAAGLAGRLSNKVYRSTVTPRWLDGGRQLWYRMQTGPESYETVLVDTRSGRRQLAFDHARLAAALGERTGSKLSANNLQITILESKPREMTLGFGGKRWRLDLSTYRLEELAGSGSDPAADTLRPFLPARASANGEQTLITLENKSSRTVDLFWIDNAGERVKYGTLAPGETRVQNTYAGHVWLFAATDGTALAAFSAEEGPSRAVFDGTSPTPQRPRQPGLSPDGKRRAFFRDSNVWLQEGERQTQLTFDGKPGDAYGRDLVWSPNGRFVATTRVEAGDTRKVSIVRSSPRDQLQPSLMQIDYLKPGDKIARERLVLIEVANGKVTPADESLTPNPWDLGRFRWTSDSRELLFVYNERGHQVVRLLAVDPESGRVRSVIEETSPTFVDYNSKLWFDLVGPDVLWMSERSGWNHLYRIDLHTGRVRNAITSGEWLVRSVERVDPERQELILQVLGHPTLRGDLLPPDPYHVHYIRVKMDGTGAMMLTQSDGTHRPLQWAPDGESYVTTYSRVDLPPVTELRSRAGKLLSVLETADASALEAAGWMKP
ncbi:MAG TPA: DPP IV N-terminal domain-containing protein, partial [Fimbriimonadaceae bacterium]|nr:DPP IV N-terminal domain-containing protein [Fimbriimonadaceae bacterium]